MLLICKHTAANHATFTSNQLDYAHYLGYRLWSWFKVRKLDIDYSVPACNAVALRAGWILDIHSGGVRIMAVLWWNRLIFSLS